MVNSFALLVVSFAVLVIYIAIYDIGGNIPHGPTGFPIIGYYFFLSSRPYKDLQNLAKIYGPIFSLQLGSQHCIVLDDYQLIKDASAQDTFSEPPENLCDAKNATRETGTLNSLSLKEQRWFSLQMLEDLEFGEFHLENLIKEEIGNLLSQLAHFDGQPVKVRSALLSSIFNNIASLAFGKRLKPDDPIRQMLDQAVIDESAIAGQLNWRMFFPRLANVAKFFKPESEGKMAQLLKNINNFILEEISEHERTLNKNNPRDYIDGYLIEIENRNDTTLCKEVLGNMVGAFFGACSETILLTVEWLVLITAHNQDVQKKIQQEIDDMIGAERLPSWTDYSKMPYTEATIMELMRLRTIIPIDIVTYNLWDTELDGYFIPKDSYVLANLWSVHHNPNYWGEDVNAFRPERFLTENGKEVITPEYFIPFPTGQRVCPSESYSQMEIFLYFTSILQKFNISLSEGTNHYFNGQLDIGLDSQSHAVYLKKRF